MNRVEGMAASIAVLLSNIELMAIAVFTNLVMAISLSGASTYPAVSFSALILAIGFTYHATKAHPLRFVRKYLYPKFE